MTTTTEPTTTELATEFAELRKVLAVMRSHSVADEIRTQRIVVGQDSDEPRDGHHAGPQVRARRGRRRPDQARPCDDPALDMRKEQDVTAAEEDAFERLWLHRTRALPANSDNGELWEAMQRVTDRLIERHGEGGVDALDPSRWHDWRAG
jgi:hypothetical protein